MSAGRFTWGGPPLVCPECRVPPAASALDAGLCCPACGARYGWLGEGIPIVATNAVRARVEASDAPGPLPADGQLQSWLSPMEAGSAAFASVGRAATLINADPSFYQSLCDELVAGRGPLGKVIDLGCGTGGMALALAARGGAVTGIDLDAHQLRWAERLAAGGTREVPVRASAATLAGRLRTTVTPKPAPLFVAANALDPPFAAESFDAAVLVNVLDAVPFPAVLLRQAVALVPRGGSIIFASPDAWAAPLIPKERWLAIDESGWDAVFRSAGLETVRRMDDLEWRLEDTPRLSHVYRVHARLLQRC